MNALLIVVLNAGHYYAYQTEGLLASIYVLQAKIHKTSQLTRLLSLYSMACPVGLTSLTYDLSLREHVHRNQKAALVIEQW